MTASTCPLCCAAGLRAVHGARSPGWRPGCAATAESRMSMPLCCHGGGDCWAVRGRWRPRLGQILEQHSQLRGCPGLQRSAHPIVELRSVDASLRHVLLQKSDRLVTVGIADARFHGSLRRLGWLVSEGPRRAPAQAWTAQSQPPVSSGAR